MTTKKKIEAKQPARPTRTMTRPCKTARNTGSFRHG